MRKRETWSPGFALPFAPEKSDYLISHVDSAVVGMVASDRVVNHRYLVPILKSTYSIEAAAAFAVNVNARTDRGWQPSSNT